jgi:hypothetical protein
MNTPNFDIVYEEVKRDLINEGIFDKFKSYFNKNWSLKEEFQAILPFVIKRVKNEFKNLYETYIETNKYGKYTRLTNLEIILDSLESKSLLPTMEKLISIIKENLETIKERLISNKSSGINDIINDVIQAV